MLNTSPCPTSSISSTPHLTSLTTYVLFLGAIDHFSGHCERFIRVGPPFHSSKLIEVKQKIFDLYSCEPELVVQTPKLHSVIYQIGPKVLDFHDNHPLKLTSIF